LIKSVIRFINSAAESFVMYPHHLVKVCDFLMWVLQQTDGSRQLLDMQDLVYKTILELTLYCRGSIGESEFLRLFNFFESSFRNIKIEQLQILMEAIMTCCM